MVSPFLLFVVFLRVEGRETPPQLCGEQFHDSSRHTELWVCMVLQLPTACLKLLGKFLGGFSAHLACAWSCGAMAALLADACSPNSVIQQVVNMLDSIVCRQIVGQRLVALCLWMLR